MVDGNFSSRHTKGAITPLVTPTLHFLSYGRDGCRANIQQPLRAGATAAAGSGGASPAEANCPPGTRVARDPPGPHLSTRGSCRVSATHWPLEAESGARSVAIQRTRPLVDCLPSLLTAKSGAAYLPPLAEYGLSCKARLHHNLLNLRRHMMHLPCLSRGIPCHREHATWLITPCRCITLGRSQ